jgi:hypothetical protein
LIRRLRWGIVFGDHIVAAAIIGCIVHRADVITLKGSSYRLKNTGIKRLTRGNPTMAAKFAETPPSDVAEVQ